MKRILPVLLFFGSACSSPTSPTPGVPLGRDFALKPGETVAIQGTRLTVGFESVLDDSRCPADVVCVWQGEAVLALRVSEGGEPSRLDLTTNAPEKRVGSYRIRLARVEPYPFAAKPIEPGDYRVILTVTRG